MSASGLRVIVSGYLAQYPLGGVAWDYMQFVLGFARLGHDVYYVEDTRQWPYDPRSDGLGEDCAYNVQYLSDLFSRFGLEDRWSLRFFWTDEWFGLSGAQRAEVLESADLLVNVSGALADPGIVGEGVVRAYVDTDPVFTQIKLVRGDDHLRRQVDAHDVRFTVGETLGEGTPDTGHLWIPMRHPIEVSEWRTEAPPGATFTTVMNWTSYKDIEFEGDVYGQKDTEFRRFLELPARVPTAELEVAVNSGKTRHAPREHLRHLGWRVSDPRQVCPDLESYRSYIQTSRAEWSVAKNGYVKARCGWFSGRSAAYLAAGRPVVVQDTGFSQTLPTGEGIVPFTTLDEAAAAVEDVLARPELHAQAACEIAESCFDSIVVLDALVEGALGADGGVDERTEPASPAGTEV